VYDGVLCVAGSIDGSQLKKKKFLSGFFPSVFGLAVIMVFMLKVNPAQAQSYYSSAPVSLKRTYQQQTDSGTVIIYSERQGAKNYFITEEFFPFSGHHKTVINPVQSVVNQRKPGLLSVHGNIQYDFTYRSFVDTPFSQRDFAQHTLQTTLDFTFRDRYPVRVTLLTRQSNSPYFDDLTDVNVQFSQRNFIQMIRENLASQFPLRIGKERLEEAELIYKQKKLEADCLKEWISHPGRLQEIVEAKEKVVINRSREIIGNIADSLNSKAEIPAIPISIGNPSSFVKEKAVVVFEKHQNLIKDSLNTMRDSVIVSIRKDADSLQHPDLLIQYRKKKEELDKLIKEAARFEDNIKAVRKTILDSVALLKQELSKIKDPSALKGFIREHKLNVNNLPKGWQVLSAINTIGLGRTWIDYSELTVQNISLSGINTEINSGKIYLAFAAGRVNYRFRDFVIKNKEKSHQSLYLFRAGVGRKEGNNLIFTWYDGKRNLLNAFSGAQIGVSNLERVMGLSVQTRIQVNENNYLVLESAKSSFNNTDTNGRSVGKLLEKVWNFKDRSNEAWCVKLFSFWPESNTRINGYYRKMGEHFQSFNLQPVNVDQEAYHFKMQQTFWKKKLQLDMALRKNDFSNPLIYPGISSKTVFKSFQVTLRVPKYPFVSIGYYPSSQLTVLENNIIAENQYNTLSAVISHAYRVKRTALTSNAVYIKFYNNGADTGFIYYNASSICLNQYIFLKGIQLQAGFAQTRNRDVEVSTWEATGSYQFRQWLMLSGGMKYNRLNREQSLWGGCAGLGLIIKRLGTVQLNYDRSYFPGTLKNLLPVDMGRVSYLRVF
jgi:hypothetical protein